MLRSGTAEEEMEEVEATSPAELLRPTALLCVFGFFCSLRPAEPFLTAFLLGPKNLTESQVVNEIYPVWTYSYLALLFPVFLATDYLRYKPVLVLQAGSLVATYATLAWARGAAAMQLMEFFFGVATASEVAYYAYIYSVVPAACYQRVTGYCRGATLLGSAAGSLSGQLLVTVASVPLRCLVHATLASAVVAFAVPWFLPAPGRSLFFHPGAAAETTMAAAKEEEETAVHAADDSALEPPEDGESKVPLNGEQVVADPRAGPQKDGGGSSEGGSSGGGSSGLAEVLRVLWEDFRRCYARRPLLAWSAWWALSTCGYFQVVNYAQPLWERVRSPHDPALYNGYVETLSTMLGALAALAVGSVRVSWAAWGELALCVFSGVMAACVFTMDLARDIRLCYASYVLFRGAYTLLITIATFQIAASLSVQRYALVFGVNTMAALLLQTALTLVVVDTAGLGLDIFPQFLVYGCYFAAIAAIFLLATLHTLASRGRTEPPAVPGDSGGDTASDAGSPPA